MILNCVIWIKKWSCFFASHAFDRRYILFLLVICSTLSISSLFVSPNGGYDPYLDMKYNIWNEAVFSSSENYFIGVKEFAFMWVPFLQNDWHDTQLEKGENLFSHIRYRFPAYILLLNIGNLLFFYLSTISESANAKKIHKGTHFCLLCFIHIWILYHFLFAPIELYSTFYCYRTDFYCMIVYFTQYEFLEIFINKLFPVLLLFPFWIIVFIFYLYMNSKCCVHEKKVFALSAMSFLILFVLYWGICTNSAIASFDIGGTPAYHSFNSGFIFLYGLSIGLSILGLMMSEAIKPKK